MKKKNVKALLLNKKSISKLSKTHKLYGGAKTSIGLVLVCPTVPDTRCNCPAPFTLTCIECFTTVCA